MDIMLRNGQELNIRWTLSISLFFHILILVFLLSYNLFTKTSSFERMYKPFTAVQVNLVDMQDAGLMNTNISVSSKQSAVSRLEDRSKKQEVRSQKQEVRNKKLETVSRHEDAVIKSAAVPPLENKKQGSASAVHGAEVRNTPASVQTGLTSKDSSGIQEARLATPWSSDKTGGITGGIAGTAGPAVDVPDFKYDYYLGLIRNKVDNRWNQPVTYTHVKKAVVEFTIQRNGRVDNVRISESSGDTYFDQTAVRAVSVSAPFPPLPKGYKENSLRVRYKFIFEKTGMKAEG